MKKQFKFLSVISLLFVTICCLTLASCGDGKSIDEVREEKVTEISQYTDTLNKDDYTDAQWELIMLNAELSKNSVTSASNEEAVAEAYDAFVKALNNITSHRDEVMAYDKTVVDSIMALFDNRVKFYDLDSEAVEVKTIRQVLFTDLTVSKNFLFEKYQISNGVVNEEYAYSDYIAGCLGEALENLNASIGGTVSEYIDYMLGTDVYMDLLSSGETSVSPESRARRVTAFYYSFKQIDFSCDYVDFFDDPTVAPKFMVNMYNEAEKELRECETFEEVDKIMADFVIEKSKLLGDLQKVYEEAIFLDVLMAIFVGDEYETYIETLLTKYNDDLFEKMETFDDFIKITNELFAEFKSEELYYDSMISDVVEYKSALDEIQAEYIEMKAEFDALPDSMMKEMYSEIITFDGYDMDFYSFDEIMNLSIPEIMEYTEIVNSSFASSFSAITFMGNTFISIINDVAADESLANFLSNEEQLEIDQTKQMVKTFAANRELVISCYYENEIALLDAELAKLQAVVDGITNEEQLTTDFGSALDNFYSFFDDLKNKAEIDFYNNIMSIIEDGKQRFITEYNAEEYTAETVEAALYIADSLKINVMDELGLQEDDLYDISNMTLPSNVESYIDSFFGMFSSSPIVISIEERELGYYVSNFIPYMQKMGTAAEPIKNFYALTVLMYEIDPIIESEESTVAEKVAAYTKLYTEIDKNFAITVSEYIETAFKELALDDTEKALYSEDALALITEIIAGAKAEAIATEKANTLAECYDIVDDIVAEAELEIAAVDTKAVEEFEAAKIKAIAEAEALGSSTNLMLYSTENQITVDNKVTAAVAQLESFIQGVNTIDEINGVISTLKTDIEAIAKLAA